MAKARSPNRDKAFKLWRKSGGTLKLKELAEQLGVSAGLIRKWKNIDKWNERMSNVTNKGNTDNGNGTDRNNGKFAVGNKAAEGFGAPLGNNNAAGNCGGAPLKNQNARKHGFYSKFIPPEDLAILEDAPGAGSLEKDLQFARYKLANLQRCQHEQKKRMIGVAIGPYRPDKYELQDDFYENMIQKQLKLIADIEVKINKIQQNGMDGGDDKKIEIIDDLEAGKIADKT